MIRKIIASFFAREHRVSRAPQTRPVASLQLVSVAEKSFPSVCNARRTALSQKPTWMESHF